MSLRGIAVALGPVLVIAGSFCAWELPYRQADRFIVPHASDIQITSHGFGEQEITYQAPGSPYGWYFAVTRNLGADGWSAPVDNRVRLQVEPDIHWRIRPLGFLYIEERVALQGDPNAARILISRHIIIPWRQYLP